MQPLLRALVTGDDMQCDGGDVEEEEDKEEDPFSFKPIFSMGQWEDIVNEDKRVSIAILLPSGVGGEEKNHDLRVSEDGNHLIVSVLWPQALVDVEMLHKSWLDGTPTGELSLRIQSFKN